MQIQLDPYWNYLQVLNISKNLYLTDSGLVTIAKRLGNTLEEIDISNCCIVTDEGVVEFSKNCKKLRAVKLSSVRITNASLVAFSRFNHETLTSVDFSLCEDITDDGMIALIFAINENLKYININECLLLTDETLMNISDYCINIQSLDLKSPYITTYGIAKLLKYTFAVNICGQFGQLIPLPSVMLRGKPISELSSLS